MSTFIKDPDAVLDYRLDWSQWLEEGEVINASTWTVPAGLTQPTAAVMTDTTTTVWLSGGTSGSAYEVTNRISTTAGRTTDQSIHINVRNL